jgi:hypothetical protein
MSTTTDSCWSTAPSVGRRIATSAAIRGSWSRCTQDDPYAWTAINGTIVSIETGEVAEQHIDFLNQKYHDGERWEYVPGSVRVLYRIRPDRIVRG